MYTEGEADFQKSPSSDLIWRGTNDDLSRLCRSLGHFEALKARTAYKETREIGLYQDYGRAIVKRL